MYYGYERMWGNVKWGRDEAPDPMSRREKALWSIGTLTTLALIFYLLLEVHPKIKAKQASQLPSQMSQMEVVIYS